MMSMESRYSAVASATFLGMPKPSFCHFRQPSTAQRRMAGPSVSSLDTSWSSRLSFGNWTSNGTRCTRRQIE